MSALSGLSSTTSTTSSSTDAASKKAALDKDAFLKLLVAQLSNQDPSKPTEGTEFVQQLSQFALVEQSIAQSASLEVLGNQVKGLSYNEATGLVNQTVTIHGKGIAFDGQSATGASVTLSGPAEKVTVQIQDANGRTVRTMEMGKRSAGAMGIAWDGKTDTGETAPKGAYSVKVEATGANGSIVNASQDVTGRVQKVSFEKGYPELILDSGVTAPISDLISVGGVSR